APGSPLFPYTTLFRSDHDGRAPGGGHHRLGVGGALHVAVADHRDRDRVDDAGDDLPRRAAAVLLRAGARMDGDRVDALALRDARSEEDTSELQSHLNL